MEELEIKEKELTMLLKLKELEVKTMLPYEPHSKSVALILASIFGLYHPSKDRKLTNTFCILRR